jgi:methionine-rich copper-binding protein CopC
MIKPFLFGLTLAMSPMLASAHSKSEATTPADGATVTEVPELSMQFDGPMRIISITLSSSEGEVALERETGMDPAKEFRAVPVEELTPGSYRFDWRGMAADGHPMQGGFSFTVAE